jgi:apolipoprotein N-acyltransferase
MKNFMTKENMGQRFTQFIILIAHLVLLIWIIFTLYEGGILPFKTLLLHFLGISVYGAVLIRTCAYLYKRQYLKELEQSERNKNLDQ